MRKMIAAVLILVLIGSLVFTGCNGGSSSEGGLTFVKLEKYANDKNLNGQKFVIGNKDKYVCIVGKDAPSDLVIPDEYHGVPVYMLTSDLDSSTEVRFTSISIGNNVGVISQFAVDDNSCENLTELIIPEGVKSIRYSFKNCRSLTRLVLPESLKTVENCFIGMESLKSLSIPEGTESIRFSFDDMSDAEISVAGNTYFSSCLNDSTNVTMILNDESQMENVAGDLLAITVNVDGHKSIHIGTRDLLDYSAMADEEAVLNMGQTHFCEVLDPAKEIDPSEAGSYAGFLDGPVVTVEICPNVKKNEYTEQDRNALLNEAHLLYLGIDCMAGYNPGRYYHPDTSKAPSVYFIAEKMVGHSESYIGSNGGEVIYHMAYRISVRNIQNDELICWFVAETGKAPRSNPSSLTEGELKFLTNGDRPDPWYVVSKYFCDNADIDQNDD
ncbi:MAG: leucine-rich repeat domain-containing protein [Clostridiales bacterium]|nr:leucine-rich repeat domain-containing protein [Clostridiales bacterium]